jgi:NADH-quinone oxidoreductase subunit G
MQNLSKDSHMPTVTIDNVPYEFEPGAKLLQFCLDLGIELPHFCYHPSMSVPANCRQCLVKVGMPVRNRETGELEMNEDGSPLIRYFPKLQTSCSTDLADGMVVETHRSSDEVQQAQVDNLELLLINHPLDCPICDQAGQCPLQNQAYKYGPEGSRFEFQKVHKPKRIQLGPRVTLDAERCINCTRCTRFTEEVSGSNQLTIHYRGVRNYPITAPGEVFDEPYSMNVVDICPVGALTSTDFRFKARVWEMSKTPSISGYCSKGTNVDYWVRDNLIMQITPRQNLDVNGYWMADEERLAYSHFNENRPSGPWVMKAGQQALVGWPAVVDTIAETLKSHNSDEIAFLGSAYATVEDNFVLMRLADALKVPVLGYLPHREPGGGDGWLVTDDRAPNARGCELLGLAPLEGNALRGRLKADGIRVLVVMEDDPVGSGFLDAEDLSGVTVILHHYNTTNRTAEFASVGVPAATIVETAGTMVNEDGRAQRVRPAKAIREINRTLLMEMGKSRIDNHGTPFDRWYNEENKVDCKPSWDVLQDVATTLGLSIQFKSARAIMQAVAETKTPFARATYDAMGMLGVPLEDVAALES